MISLPHQRLAIDFELNRFKLRALIAGKVGLGKTIEAALIYIRGDVNDVEPLVLFTTAFLVGFSGAIMPGPVTAVMARHALEKGFMAGPLVTAGHAVLEALMVAMLAAGLGRFFTGTGPAAVIGLAGGVVLAWMGYGMLRGALKGSFSLQAPAPAKGIHHNPLVAGMVTTVANPYWFLWWATVGAGYITISSEHGAMGALLFFGGHILSDLAWLSFLAAILVTGKRLLTDRVFNVIIAFLGVFLLAMAAYFLWSGFNFWRGQG